MASIQAGIRPSSGIRADLPGSVESNTLPEISEPSYCTLMMSPFLGEGPAGPDATPLYCRPEGRAPTPGALAFWAKNWPGSAGAAAGAEGAAGWAWAAPEASRAA